MVFGPGMPPAEQIDLDALTAPSMPPRGTDAWLLALMGRQFPGSWLPFGREQVVRCAAPALTLVNCSNGRLDYIETITRWNERIGARSVPKTMLKLMLVPRWLMSRDFRIAFTSGVSANKVCFERQLLDHWRLVFEKRRGAMPLASSRPSGREGLRRCARWVRVGSVWGFNQGWTYGWRYGLSRLRAEGAVVWARELRGSAGPLLGWPSGRCRRCRLDGGPSSDGILDYNAAGRTVSG